MKVSSIFKGLFLGQVLLMATSAFATTKGGLTLQEAVTVNGTRLATGDYQVKWEGTGPEVEMSIFKSRKLVATVPAHFVELAHPEQLSAYGSEKGENGTVSRPNLFPREKVQVAGRAGGVLSASDERGK